MEDEDILLDGGINPILNKLKNKGLEPLTTEDLALEESKIDLTGMGKGIGKFQGKVIPEYYRKIGIKLGWNPYSLPQDMEKEAYLSQSGVEVLGNTVQGFGVQALAGAIDSLAAWDMEGLYDMSVGNTEKEYGNWLNEIGKDLREIGNENFQIYQDGDSMWNSSYWAKQIQSLGYTGGIIAEMIAEQVALAYIAPGAGNATGLASKARLLKMGGQGAFGMWKGVQEGYMNALETSENVYQKYKDLGYDDEAAQKKASEAATLGFRAEVGPLAALNALQFMTTFGVAKTAFTKTAGSNLGFSGGIETLVDRALPSVTSKWSKSAIGFGVNALSEGIEEGIQTGVGKYAQHETLKSTGDAQGNLEIWDSEMRDSMIGGVLGGGLFAGAGKLLNPYIKNTAAKQYSKAHDNFLSNAVSRTAGSFENQQNITDLYRQADQAYNKNKSKKNLIELQQAEKAVREAQYNSHLTSTINALQLDYITGNTSAFESHIEQMQSILDATNNKDLEALKKYGIVNKDNKERYKGSFKTIQSTFEQNILDSEQIKKSLENNLLNVTSDFESAFNITKKEYLNSKSLDDISSYHGALDLMYRDDKQFNQLTSEGKERFQLEAELESLNRLESLSENNTQRKEEIQEELKSSTKYTSKDKRVVDSIAKNPYVSAYASISSIEQSVDGVNNELSKLRDEKIIAKNIKIRKENAIRKAKSKEEVDDVVQEATQNGVVTPEMETQAEVKKSELSSEETIKKSNPNFIAKQNVKPKEASKEVTEDDSSSEDLLAQMLKSGKLTTKEEEQAFSPREFNEQGISEEQLQEITNVHNKIASKLDNELNKPATFQDFINDKVEKTSFDNADKMFEAYKFAWSSIGRDISSATNVYNDTFNIDNLSENILSQFITNKAKSQEITNIVDTAIVEKSKTSKFDSYNRPIDKDGNYSKDGRTSISKPKAAHLGIQYKEIKNEDGTLSKIPVLPQLNESQQITNHYLLDSDFIKPGTTLEVIIPDNVDNIKVANWTFIDNKWVKSEITFGDWAIKNTAKPGTTKYNSKVPMVATIEGEKIFFLHDTDWYNTTNIANTEDQIDVIKKGKNEILSLRQEVLKGNTSIKIEERKFGSILKLNTLEKNNKSISLNEATGDTKLTVASSFTELSDYSFKSNGAINSKINLVNNLGKNKFERGQIYEIRKVNKDQHIALPVFTNNRHENEPINDTAYNNVKYSVISSVILNVQNNKILLQELESKFGMTISKAEDIQNNIRKTTGIDVKYEIGDYISMFAQVEEMNSFMVAKLEDMSIDEQTGKAKYPSNTNYISVDNAIIKIANKDGKIVSKNKSGYDTLRGINLNSLTEKATPVIISILEENFSSSNGKFRSTSFDISKNQIGRNKKFTVIADNGSVSTNNTYENYIKDSVKTNVKSFPIKTKDGETKWITDVQPMIYFGLSNQKNVTSTVETAQKAAQEVLEDINIVQKQNLQEAISEVPTDLKEETLRILKGIEEVKDIDLNHSRRELNETQQKEIGNIQSNQLNSISPLQQKKLINSLFNLIVSDIELNNGSVNLGKIKQDIDSSLITYVQPEIDKIKINRDNLVNLNNNSLSPIINKFNSKLEQLETIIKESEKIISNGFNTPKGDLYKKFERFLSEELTNNEDMMEDDNGEVVFSFNSSSLEKDVKLTFSNNLKIFFANIRKQKNNRQDIINFAYLNEYESVDNVIQSLTEVMVGLPSSIEELISILETKKEDSVYNQILNKIKNSSEEIQNEILYKMIQSKLDMYMVLYSYNKDANTYSLKIINPNSSSSDIKLKQQWNSNFKNSNLLKTVKDERVFNIKPTTNFIKKIDDLSTIGKLDISHLNVLKPIFLELGINVSDNTIETLLTKQGNNIITSSGILGVFKNNLKTILNKNKNEEIISLQDENNNPYNNAKGVIDEIVNLEIELNGTRVSKSFRVGGKSIQGAIQKMMVYDIKEQLKDTSSNLFTALKEIPYSKNNYVLNLLETSEKFRNYFDIGFISLEAIKQNKQKVYDDRKINKLATTDNMLTQYAFFQNTLKELGEIIPNTNLNFRMGHMFNPSISDKEQMILYSTALVDLNYKNFDIPENNIVKPSNDILNFITEQIYSSEFDRIVNTYNTPTNIKNYDGAAKRFLSIPELNNIVSKEGANIHDVIKLAVNSKEDTTGIKEQFKTLAKDIIANTIEADVKSKIDVTEKKGSWFDNGFVNVDNNKFQINFFDNKYLNSKKGKNKGLSQKVLAQISAYDFVINQFLNQNNTYQLIAGDMALYAPNIKKFTNKETGVIDNIAFTNAVGEAITKRMAMLIAPGNKLANSKDDKYLQIFVNDPIKVTSTTREFIKQYYGSVSEVNNELLSKLNEVENSVRNLYNSRRTHDKFDSRLAELTNTRDNIMSQLKDNNAEIAGYFEIEGTDAQEYTTWKEHMDILFRQGRLTVGEKEILQNAYNKLLKGKELDSSELKVVMNPIKPVYAGNVFFNDKDGKPNVNRIVYIKSSSFPLLPQLTKDFKINKIREQLEALENKSGKNVRLSYQTANKIGAITTKLTTNDLYNIPFEELEASKLKDATLELDRNNFKIQQDTPYKTSKFLKKNQDDMTTMGSQMWKIILGNGINKIDKKIFPHLFGKEIVDLVNKQLVKDFIIPENGMVSGRDLDKLKFHIEKMYFDIQKELLFDELGLDRQTRKPIDTNETIKLLYKLLQRETTTRQYPEGIIDNLELTYTQEELEFVLPIWLSNGSDKFESLLQSIITNRLVQIKLPGNQLISSSSEGFERITNLEELDTNIKSQIVWVDPGHTGELKATIIDGKVKESEVLLQSKFRKTYKDSNGKVKTKLIDLTKQPYSTFENGVLKLNTDMIDEELLNNFSFRIPTSSHQSGAILKIVGFLPEASGDMLVVPKEHTQQIGEDFDIDKRTLYKSNYSITENGKILKINYTNENKEIENLMYSIFNEDYLSHLSTDEGKSKYASLKAKIKMLENGMIDIYKSVYLSPDNNIQKKINKILSFDNATKTTNFINDRLNSSIDNKYFSIYSDEYQRKQMKLGANGKAGIGVHSNAVTFQAQMERLNNNLKIQDAIIDDKGRTTGYSPRSMTIGRFTSDGVLGNIETLDRERSIADVHTENQNAATDNIKAQIMGKRNENSYTMNILTQLTYRGFDMDRFSRVPNQNTVQLPSLFISQPILRRYVELKEQNKSITSKFSSNSEQIILDKLFTEFGKDVQIIKSDRHIDKTNFLKLEDYQVASKKMTGDVLYDNLINQPDLKTWDSSIQLAVLQKFFKLEEESKHIGKYQSLLNMSTTGLGISYFNVLDRIQSLNDMGYEQNIDNIKSLVGDFVHKEVFEENPISDDYILIGDFYINPTTTEGTVLIQALSSAEDIMDISFPYKARFIERTIKKIITGKDREISKKQKMDLQYKVISNIRDYLYAIENIGLINGDINSERFRLFFDKDNNESLTSFMKKLSDNRHPLMISNELLKSLIFDGVQKNGSPSIIKHQADYNTNFDKTDKYNAFLELLQDNTTNLGIYNGETMTPRKLAQDLAAYAYLANNENGAIGFRDFINVKYLNIMDVSKNIRDINKNRNGWNIDFLMSSFQKQFYQHNPEEAKIINQDTISIDSFLLLDNKSNKLRNKINTVKEKEKKSVFFNMLKGLKEFTLKEEGPNYIAIRNTNIKLSDNQYNLYEFDGTKYIQIPVLGTFGFNEYNPYDSNQKSLIYPEVGQDILQQSTVRKSTDSNSIDLEKALDLSNGVQSLLEQIAASKNQSYSEFAKKLAPFIDSTTQVKVEAIETPTGTLNSGVFKKSENTIYLNPDIINHLLKKKTITEDNVLNVVEEVLLEEIIHSMTISELDKHGTFTEGVYTPNNDAPIFITKLAKLYALSSEKLPYNLETNENYYNKNIYEFVAGVFVDKDFRDRLDSGGLYKKFLDAMAAMLRYVTNSTYSDEVINSVYELLENTVKPINNQTTVQNTLEEIKRQDSEIDKIINNINTERVELNNNLKIISEYNKKVSKNLLSKFNTGEEMLITPKGKRVKNSIEYQYMEDIINSLGENPRDKIIITTINPTTQSLKKKISLEDMIKAGLLKTTDNYSQQEARLPEIKKCKE